MADQNYYEMGERISYMRKANHMTQEQLAEHLNISVKHISEVERGLTSLSMEKLIAVAKLFNCTLDYLIRGTETDDISYVFPETMIRIMRYGDEQEKRLLREYLHMYAKLHPLTTGEGV